MLIPMSLKVKSTQIFQNDQDSSISRSNCFQYLEWLQEFLFSNAGKRIWTLFTQRGEQGTELVVHVLIVPILDQDNTQFIERSCQFLWIWRWWTNIFKFLRPLLQYLTCFLHNQVRKLNLFTEIYMYVIRVPTYSLMKGGRDGEDIWADSSFNYKYIKQSYFLGAWPFHLHPW